MIDSKGYRPNVGIILCNSEGRVFWAKRMGVEAWQFPQGGINDDEDPETAMYRELWEETGLERQHVQVLGRTRYWLRYQLPEKYLRKNSMPLCVGQKQIWYMVRLLTTDAHVRFDHCSKPEFDDWRWVDFWEPLKDVVYFKRRVYQKAMTELVTFLSTDETLATAIGLLPKEPYYNFIDSNGYSPNIGIILCNNEGQLLWTKLVGREDWQFPEGSILNDEDPETAMYRELRETIGLEEQQVQVLGRTRYWLRYQLPEQYSQKNSLPLCIGQKHIWYMLRLHPSDCNLGLNDGFKQEIDNWQWVDYWDPFTKVVYFKRKAYQKALMELANCINP